MVRLPRDPLAQNHRGQKEQRRASHQEHAQPQAAQPRFAAFFLCAATYSFATFAGGHFLPIFDRLFAHPRMKRACFGVLLGMSHLEWNLLALLQSVQRHRQDLLHRLRPTPRLQDRRHPHQPNLRRLVAVHRQMARSPLRREGRVRSRSRLRCRWCHMCDLRDS